MISPGYLQEQRALNAKGQGGKGFKWADTVLALCEKLGASQLLDYGCGQATLGLNLRRHLRCRNYDPAVERWAQRPVGPFEFVVCTDVMEHVEPAYIGAVLDDIRDLMAPGGHVFFVISTRESNKFLSDGRNAHLNIHGPLWWRQRITPRFSIIGEPEIDTYKQYVVVARKPE